MATLIAEQEAMNLGSVRYMAPELFGSTAADGRCDVYSLGLIFYEMLVGRSAFQEAFRSIFKDDRNQALRWMKWHTNARLQAPPADELNPALPATLSQLAARAIAKDVHDRIGTAGELADAIERHFTTQGVADNIDQRVTARRAAAQSTAAVQAASDTAELPGAKAGSKRWWVPALLAASVAITLGMLVLFSGGGGPSGAELEAMRQSLSEADQAWRGGDLAAAESGYASIHQTSLETDLPSDLAAPAHAGLLTVRTRRAMDDGALDEAASTLGELQQLPAADAETVDVLRRELRRRQDFARYEDRIVASLEAGRLAEARDTIEAFRREGLMLSSAETDRLNELDAQEVGLRVRQAMQRDLDEVERLVARDRVDEAVDDLRRMERQYAEPEVRQRLAELLGEQRYTQAMADYQSALDDGDLPAAIRYMVLAQESRPDDSNLAERLSGLRVREALARGQRAQAENRLEVAREAYAEALSYGSAPEALTALSLMDTAEERDALVRRADEAMNANDFDLAINLYEAASGLGAQSETQTDLAERLQRARVGKTLLQAEDAFANGDLDTARQRFEQVLRISPGHDRAESGLRSVGQSAEYVRLVEQGDRARAGSRFGEAMNSYRAARELIHTEQIDRLIDETEYQQLIAQARVALAQKNPQTARALLQTARGIRAGEVIDELMQQIRDLEASR